MIAYKLHSIAYNIWRFIFFIGILGIPDALKGEILAPGIAERKVDQCNDGCHKTIFIGSVRKNGY